MGFTAGKKVSEWVQSSTIVYDNLAALGLASITFPFQRMDIPNNSLICLQGGYASRLDNGGARARAEDCGRRSGDESGLMRV